MGVPPNHPKLDQFSIETYGDLGPQICRSICSRWCLSSSHRRRDPNDAEVRIGGILGDSGIGGEFASQPWMAT